MDNKKYISSGLSGDDDTVLHREVGLMGSPPPTMKALMAVPSMAKTMMEPMLAKKFPANIQQDTISLGKPHSSCEGNTL